MGIDCQLSVVVQKPYSCHHENGFAPMTSMPVRREVLSDAPLGETEDACWEVADAHFSPAPRTADALWEEDSDPAAPARGLIFGSILGVALWILIYASARIIWRALN
jgi:hypothetical protein